MVNEKINHMPNWNKKELEIVYMNYNKLSIRQLCELLPNRSFSAIKNKVKKIKFAI